MRKSSTAYISASTPRSDGTSSRGNAHVTTYLLHVVDGGAARRGEISLTHGSQNVQGTWDAHVKVHVERFDLQWGNSALRTLVHRLLARM
jgi:hypothetical protein